MRTNRRNFLRALGTAAIAGAAGCLTEATTVPDDSPGGSDPQDLSFETHSYRANDLVVVDGIGPDSVGERYATVLTDETAAKEFVSGALDDATRAFIDGTDLASEDLLVVQTYLDSISTEFTLDSVQRAGTELRVSATVDEAEMGAQAITYETVLARVESGSSTPEQVSLSVGGGSPATFAVESPEPVEHGSMHLHHTDALYQDGLTVSDGSGPQFRVRTLTSADAFTLDGQAEDAAFVENTDFSTQAILALEKQVPSPCESLAAEGVEQGRRLRLRAAVEETDAMCTQQVQLSTLLVRVPAEATTGRKVAAVVTGTDGSERAVLAGQ
ncbi:twin-arginine translocation signal domain-containing protein [Haloarchaeobius sp. DYHT-AS-18]|uniref:twin-arginine translocation signal domain-containing protein n=1 Tax=Haloarchaeobius sp. DYHT-AS-18 TaxID=3446117 RepID=UPI003EBB9B05